MTVTIEDLEKVTHVVSHYNCADGTASAMICSLALLPVCSDLKIDFLNYKSAETKELVATPGMLFVDFSPPYERWEEFRDVGTIVIDHHASIKDHIFGDKVIFESKNERSGALMCFEHVLLPMAEKHHHVHSYELDKWETFARYISAYDTWQKHIPRWRDAQSVTQGVLFFGIKEMLKMAKEKFDLDLIHSIGKRWNSRIYNKAKSLSEKAWIRNYLGLSIAYVNNTEKITSELGDELGKVHDLVVVYYITMEHGSPHLVCSLRTRIGMDTTKISYPMGGGGHKESSGFLIALDNMNLMPIFEQVERLALNSFIGSIIDS